MDIERRIIRNDISAPIEDRYLEDYLPGNVCECGSVRLEEADLVEFAREYDPQIMHASPELAKAGPFGGLIASGWQTLSVMTRLCCDHYISEKASRGLLGIEELRWRRPVRTGDLLWARIRVLQVSHDPWQSTGVLRSLMELLNQDGELVMTIVAAHRMSCRREAEQKRDGNHQAIE
jgi:acyl dehydratase